MQARVFLVLPGFSSRSDAAGSGEGVPIDLHIIALYAIGQVAIDRALQDRRLEAD